jgi:CRISPR-associated protein Csb1
MTTLSYDTLRDAVAGPGIGVRARTALEPLGGPGDKVFPPTYGVDGRADTKYAVEPRTIDGRTTETVVLDSVASQANRLELALLEATRDGDIDVPVVSVDFRDAPGLADIDRISSLEASHRVFDAILRDSLLGDRMFRLSDVGVAITEANVKNAAALFRYSPSTLVFGGWDSTGPKGGRGAKYERALTSEVIGIGVERGVRTSSRIDPLGIEKKAAALYRADGDGVAPDWTLDPADAQQDAKGRPTEARPSEVNHGNVAPSIIRDAGGVTVEEIRAITVLSFIQLRRLRFPVDAGGTRLEGEARRRAEVAARTALAALGLAAITLAFEEGFDLRSRCVLAPTADISFELLRRGDDPVTFTLDRAAALALLAHARDEAVAAGLAWESDEILLRPTEQPTRVAAPPRPPLLGPGRPVGRGGRARPGRGGRPALVRDPGRPGDRVQRPR